MTPSAIPIRLVDDPSAPAFRQVDTDFTYPYRQTELVAAINQRIGSGYHVNACDLFCVRCVHAIDKQPKYFHKPKFGSPQYSDDFLTWLIQQYRADPAFFSKARES